MVDSTGTVVKTTAVYNNQGIATDTFDANINAGRPGNHVSVAYDSTGLYPASITQSMTGGVHHVSYYSYDANNGNLISSTDENATSATDSSHTTYHFHDSMGRLTSTLYPDGGAVQVSYDGVSSPPKVTVTTTKGSAGGSIVETHLYDGFGRPTQTQSNSDPQGTVYTNISYDRSGRVGAVSNPYRGSGDPAFGYTSYAYDGLGRKVRQCQPDNGTANGPCVAGSSYQRWIYNGSTTTFIDEHQSSWQQKSDSLGRLTSVIEPGGLSTSYVYDTLGNLKSVSQAGGPTEAPRVRSFTYDMLSRLVASKNPETGTICYGSVPSGQTPNLNTTTFPWSTNCTPGYDANSNLVAKADARGVVTSYSYDALSRLLNKSYSDGTYPSSFAYDGYRWDGNPASSVGVTSLNAIGKLSDAENRVNVGKVFSYDVMGRINLQTGYNYPGNGGWYGSTIAAKYDLIGNMTDLTYPNGRHIKQTFDAVGRLSTSRSVDINGTAASQSYLQGTYYFPDGSPSTITYGNGVVETIGKNSRLQVQSMAASNSFAPFNGGNFLLHTYSYASPDGSTVGSNGNVYGIADTLNPARYQAFTYDPLNRIRSFSLGGVVSQAYQLDSFGNMTQVVNGAAVTTFDAATNRVSNLPCAATLPSNLHPFDAAGNQRCGTDTNQATMLYNYDAESRISTINTLSSSSPFVSYIYGADGSRAVKLNADGTFTVYVDFNGQTLTEVDQTGGTADYIYANGERIARVSSADTRLHLSGNNCASCGGPYRWFWFPAVPQALTFQQGTKLAWRQYQSGAASPGGGIFMITNTGLHLDLGVPDQNGQSMNSMTTQGQWVQRVVDLSAFNGQSPVQIGLGTDGAAGVDPWNIYMADITFIQPDGSTVTLYNGQAAGGWGQWGDQGVQGYSITSETVPLNNDPTSSGGLNAHFYLGDHLGTAQMEFAAGGWPVWQGQFAPYGGELDTQVTANHYKFAGKERDAETGLDYFGARYYASNMGRWMSPDWADRPEAVPYSVMANPQSLNLYGYEGNNPLSNADADGHCWPVCELIAPAAHYIATHPKAAAAFDKVSNGIGKAASAAGNFLDKNAIVLGSALMVAGIASSSTVTLYRCTLS